jgi:hypothetical protein
MKFLVLVLSTLVAVSASASDDRDRTQDAKMRFNQMGALEAYNSNLFNKQTANIGIPGTSTWVKGTSLCVEGDMIRTISNSYKQVCVAWSYRNNDGEKVQTSSVRLARKNDADCVSKVNGIKIESPINFTKEVTVWGAKEDGELKTVAGGKAKVYSSYSKADEAGSPVALGTKSVHVRVPTTYKVDFFRNSSQDRYDNRKFVGSHVFGVANCR